MGFPEDCFRDTPDDLIAQALHAGKDQPVWMKGMTAQALDDAGGHIRLKFEAEAKDEKFLPFADGGFRTPSGKVEFYSETLAAQGLDPLPGFVPPTESRHSSEKNAQAPNPYPLEFLPRKADNYMNSTFANLPVHQKMENGHHATLEMHRDDAASRGIADGDIVEVFNARGQIRLTARISANGHASVPAGVVASRLSWNKLSPGGHNVNLLTSQRLTDFGGGPTFYSTLVEVRKALSKRDPESSTEYAEERNSLSFR
jgi:anaerobic selenocysteine-containing dehydrogenase